MAIILTPIPQLLNSIGESAESVAQKDALFSATASLMRISLYRWDERTKKEVTAFDSHSVTEKILDTNSSNFQRESNESSTRGYGKLYRRYFDSTESNKTLIRATPPESFRDANETSSIDFDDVDDWNGTLLEFNRSRGDSMQSLEFNLSYQLFYIRDDISGFTDTTSKEVNITLDKSNLNSPEQNLTSNIKLLRVHGVQKQSKDNFRFSLDYLSTNIGKVKATDYRKKIE
jgi:hypothetical protein